MRLKIDQKGWASGEIEINGRTYYAGGGYIDQLGKFTPFRGGDVSGVAEAMGVETARTYSILASKSMQAWAAIYHPQAAKVAASIDKHPAFVYSLLQAGEPLGKIAWDNRLLDTDFGGLEGWPRCECGRPAAARGLCTFCLTEKG